MNRVFEINRIRLIATKKAGRRRPEKVIPCLWCSYVLECECKKIKVAGINWKQWVPAKQYCDTYPCGKNAVNFRSSLAKKQLSDKAVDRLTAEYCLWKMMKRTPIKFLSPILQSGFSHAIPKYPCRLTLQLPTTVSSKKLLNQLEALVVQ